MPWMKATVCKAKVG